MNLHLSEGGYETSVSSYALAYNSYMARGWESKSVEAQQSEAAEKSSAPRVRLSKEDAARRRDHESLRLSRQGVLQQLERSQNPRHRKLLQDTLAELDQKLHQFDF